MLNSFLRRTVRTQIGRYDSIASLRWLVARMDSLLSLPTAQGVSVSPVDADGLPCRWYQPPTPSPHALLYLHGGGFCLHLPQLYNGFVSRLSQRLGINILLPDYRLAPEHPFPAAPEDALTAYRELLRRGFSGDRIAVAGDSAGGSLALGLLLQIRDAKLQPPRCAVLLSPATRLPSQDPDIEERRDLDPMFTLEALENFTRHYLPRPEQRQDPLAMPLHGDFLGLPPLQFHVGSTELLLSSSINAVEKAHAAGVDAELQLWDRLPHVHPLFLFLPESKHALQLIETFICRHLGHSNNPRGA